MPKMTSLDDLQKLRDKVKSQVELREKGDKAEEMIIIKVAMATCGIAAGAREIMNYFSDEVITRKLSHVMVTQSGCIGYCYAEPTIEIKNPGEAPVVYGHVTKERAKEIVEKYILNGELVDGIISMSHQSLDE